MLGDFNDVDFTAHGVTSRFYRHDKGFFVRTDGPDGVLDDYRILYTFGCYPLQQYLIGFPDGRLQPLGIAWDSRSQAAGGQRWFHLYPDEPMDHRHPQHWTARDQTWNYQCAECHSTHLQKNYDLKTDSYKTTWSEIDVACEACHGPGSGHIAWARSLEAQPGRRGDADKGLLVDLAERDDAVWLIDPQSGKPKRSKARSRHTQIELCARCHSRRGVIWSPYHHGEPLAQGYRLALLDEALYFPDGQIKDEVFVYGSFLQSRMYRAGVTCSDCHDPHSLELRAEGNGLCTRCHQSAGYDTKDHHHHEVDSPGAACTACHMPQRTYMVVDDRADHSLRIPRPDLSLTLGTPNPCNGCHESETAAWAAKAVAAWYPDSERRKSHFGQVLHQADQGGDTATDALLALAADASQAGIVRASALGRLPERFQPRFRATLEQLMKDGDPLVRAAATRYLANADVPTRVDLAWPLLKDPVRSVRLEAGRALAELMPHRLPDKYRKQLQAVMREYMASQSMNGERPESHLNLGRLAVASGNQKNAEQAYRTALRLDRAFVPGYINLADLYRRQDREREGEALLRSALEQVGGHADLHHALGLSLVRLKRLNDALPHLRQAAETAPGNPRYAYVYGVALLGASKLNQAQQVLQQADRQHPNRPEILSALDEVARALKQRSPREPVDKK